MRINNNLMAMNAYRQLGANTNQVAKNLEKLSSGLKINRAGDDAAGLAISEKMRAQVRGLEMATKNAQDGISLIQTAEGALQETHSILQRMRELAVQSSSDTNMNEVDREAMQEELNALVEEINDIAKRTEFNTQKLIDGSFNNKVFHIGANQGQNIKVSIEAMDAEGIGLNNTITVDVEVADYTRDTEELTSDGHTFEAVVYKDADDDVAAYEYGGKYYDSLTLEDDGTITVGNEVTGFDPKATTTTPTEFTGVNISEREVADASIEIINDAINKVSTQRSNLGAIQNRLEHTINNLGASAENLTAAESRIRDTDHTQVAA